MRTCVYAFFKVYDMTIEPVARIRTDFTDKFGIPRQSGRVAALQGRIVFEPSFRNPDALREIEGFSHLWLIFDFSRAHRDGWSATVRPPRLGGNRRIGVFASRSPFRPNPIGLSSVRLLDIREEKEGPVLIIGGADLRDGTKIYDIKPYLEYADSHVNVRSGFGEENLGKRLNVIFPEELLDIYPKEKRDQAVRLLSLDPRPAYQDDPDRRYGVSFAGYDIHFKVSGENLTVIRVVPLN